MSTTQPEKRITDAIVKWLRAQGAWAVKVHGGAYGHAGQPDVSCCWQGRYLGLEVKVPGGRLTAIQQHVLGSIATAGGIAACVHSVDEVIDVARQHGLLPKLASA